MWPREAWPGLDTAWLPTSEDTPVLCFDIETDGLLDECSTVHCLCAVELPSGRAFSFGPGRIEEGLELLASAPLLVAHNGLCFDLPALGKLFTTGEGLDETSGPVGVVQLVAEQTKQGGMEIFLYLTVLISINLGLMNLLPIPGLDGSRLVFMLIEAVRRKPVDQKIEAMIHLGGYALLFGFMIFFTFKDVMRIFQ